MTSNRIHIGEDIAYEKGRNGRWPSVRFIAAIDGNWLYRKDGNLRKFKTKQAARAAAAKLTEVTNAQGAQA